MCFSKVSGLKTFSKYFSICTAPFKTMDYYNNSNTAVEEIFVLPVCCSPIFMKDLLHNPWKHVLQITSFKGSLFPFFFFLGKDIGFKCINCFCRRKCVGKQTAEIFFISVWSPELQKSLPQVSESTRRAVPVWISKGAKQTFPARKNLVDTKGLSLYDIKQDRGAVQH